MENEQNDINRQNESCSSESNMNQHEKSQVLAKAIYEAVLILNKASDFIDEPDDDCPIFIKKAMFTLNNALNECGV